MADTPDPAATREFRDAPRYYGSAGLLLAGLAIAIASFTTSAGSWLPTALAVVFGGQSLFYLRCAFVPEVRVRLTEQGIELGARSGAPAVIEWSEVLDVGRSRFGEIQIKVRDEAAVWGRMSLWTRWRRKHFSFGPTPITLQGWQLSPDTDSLLRAVEDGMDQYALRAMKAHAALPGLSTAIPSPPPQ